MATWRRGSHQLSTRIRQHGVPLEVVTASLAAHPPLRVPGTAVFLTTAPNQAPLALLHNLRHNKMLHERCIIITLDMLDAPRAPAGKRVTVETLGSGFSRVRACFGFAKHPDVPAALEACAVHGLGFDFMDTTFIGSREYLVAGERAGMARWRDHLFAFLTRNAMPASLYFRIADNRLIEIGRRVSP